MQSRLTRANKKRKSEQNKYIKEVKNTKTIIGVKLENRKEEAEEFQKIITEFGCGIKTRIGLHDTFQDKCVNSGIVILEITDDSATRLFEKLQEKWHCQKMEF